MAIISSQHRQNIPTYHAEKGQDGVPVRCRRASDSELTRILDESDEWLIAAPGLRPMSKAPEAVARRLRVLRFRLTNADQNWRVCVPQASSRAVAPSS